MNVKALSPCSRGVDTLQIQHQFVPSHTIETRLIRLPEHLAADTAYLHPLVVYHVTPALPVKQLHQRAAAVEENIHRTVRRLPSGRTGYAAEGLDSLTQVYGIAVDHKLIRFIQTKHNKT